MKKRLWLIQLGYYLISVLVYPGLLFVTNALMPSDDLGTAMFAATILLFVGFPVIIVALMRLSLLRWYVDPIAAAIAPLYLYIGMLWEHASRTGDTSTVFQKVHWSLSYNGGEGWFTLAGLFVLGLVASFSVARTRGESLGYRLLEKCKKPPKE